MEPDIPPVSPTRSKAISAIAVLSALNAAFLALIALLQIFVGGESEATLSGLWNLAIECIGECVLMVS